MFDFFKRPKKIKKCPFFGIGCDHEFVVVDEMQEHLKLESYNHSKSLIEIVESLKLNFESLKKSDEENKNEIIKLKSNEKLRDQMINSMNQEIKSIRAENHIKISENSKTSFDRRIDEMKSEVEDRNIDKIKSIFYEMELRQTDNVIKINEIESIKKRMDKINNEINRKLEDINEKLKQQWDFINETRRKYNEEIQRKIIEHESLSIEIENLRNKLDQSFAGMNSEKIDLVNKEIKVAMKNGKVLSQQIDNFQKQMNENIDKITMEMNSKRNELKQEWNNILEEKLNKINEEQNLYQYELFAKLHQTDNYLEKIIDGVLMWRIDRLFDKRRHSKPIYSKYFYPTTRPYKMLLAIRMYETRFNASLVICNESNNNIILSWPFKGQLSIKITNHYVPGISKIMTKFCEISKPFNNALGCSKALIFFFSDLQNIGLLHGDYFILECFVSEV